MRHRVFQVHATVDQRSVTHIVVGYASLAASVYLKSFRFLVNTCQAILGSEYLATISAARALSVPPVEYRLLSRVGQEKPDVARR